MSTLTEARLIRFLEETYGPLLDATATVKKRFQSERALLGPKVAGYGTFMSGFELDNAVRAVCEGVLGGPLEPPPPPPEFKSEAEAVAWAWA
jgi:hypothetical protein